jgi:hypothetical protein
VLGKDFSNDKQSCKMQGKSEYKTRCGKFKRFGLHCDFLGSAPKCGFLPLERRISC